MSKIRIRDVQHSDFNEIKRLNDDFVHFTSPMSLRRIAELDQMSFYHRLVCREQQVCGFLLAMTAGASYNSENYQWFAQRLSNFVYIDRIVIDRQQQGMKLGQLLYSHLFDFAGKAGIEQACCEYNLKPENRRSAVFHSQFGFQQMDKLVCADGKKVLSMQTRAIRP